MLSLLLLALSAAPQPPVATVDGEPITSAEARLFLTAWHRGLLPLAWPTMPETVRTTLPAGRALLEPLIEQHVAARAAQKQKLALSAADLATLPKIDPKGDDYSYFVSGAPKGVPRNDLHLSMLKRALLVQRYVRSLVPGEQPTEEDFAAVLAAHPELEMTTAQLKVRCLPPPKAGAVREKLRALVEQGKTLDEVLTATGEHAITMPWELRDSPEERETFERLRTAPENRAVAVPGGLTCSRLSHSPARKRTKEEQHDAATPGAQAIAEERAWRRIYEPLLQKAIITVDEKAVEALDEAAAKGD